ncbi:MAG TPA: heparin lyase I family protein [Humisphaera sp.]
MLDSVPSPYAFTAGFESAGCLSDWWMNDVKGAGAAVVVAGAPAPARTGHGSAKFTLPSTAQRAELTAMPDPAGSERWYGFSVFVADGVKPDAVNTIVAQWHEQPDRDLGETWRVPPLYLAMLNGKWVIATRWDSRPKSDGSWIPPAPTGGRLELRPAAVATGRWVDWVFHVKWSYASDGLLEVWKDGTKVVDRAGPNTYNDEAGNYFKVGLYTPDYATNTNPVNAVKMLFADDVRLGNETATYADVAPGRPWPPPPTGVLTINGTTGKDTISVTQSGNTLTVTRNGVPSIVDATGVTKLVLNGLAGDDKLLLDQSVTIDALLNGGGGRDLLRGGAGRDEFVGGRENDMVDYSQSPVGVHVSLDDSPDDGPASQRENVRSDVEMVIGTPFDDVLIGSQYSNVLAGGGGNDTLRGLAERDVLIGGAGADALVGGGGEDLLVAGRTSYDTNPSALWQVRSEWGNSLYTVPTRISRLSAGVSGVRLWAGTVFDDAAVDVLTGGTAKDWFVTRPADVVTDKLLGETRTTL